VGVELIFLPFAEPQHNGHVEHLNGLWGGPAFWERHHLGCFSQVCRQSPHFVEWYMHHYCRNYSRIWGREAWQDWWAHQMDQSIEAIVVLQLGRFNDGGQRRVRLRAPCRAKAVGDLAMNDRGA
jgi:hypothetical protein